MTARVPSRDLLSAGRLWLPALRELESRLPGDADAITTRAGIDRSTLDEPKNRIPLGTGAQFLRLATTTTKDPLFALRAGRRHAAESADLFLRMLLAQADLVSAMATARRFASLPIEELEVTYVRSEGRLRVDTTLMGAPIEDPLVAEYVFGIIARWIEDAGDPRLRLLALELLHSPRAPLRAYRDALDVPIRFESERTAIVLPDVNVALREADPLLASLLADHAEATIHAFPKTRTYRDRVEGLISTHIDDCELGIDGVAASLGMSGRTLRRRLERESTTFGDLLDEMRKTRALELLRDPHRSVAEVAAAVGFASAGAFRRAFARWTGTNATTYRASNGSL